MYLTLYNVVVDNFIRTWLATTVEDKRVAHYGLGESAGWCLGVFYYYGGMVGSRDPEWLQYLRNVLVGIFCRYGLAANAVKYCSMTFQPGALRSGMSAETKDLKCTGVGDSYRVRL